MSTPPVKCPSCGQPCQVKTKTFKSKDGTREWAFYYAYHYTKGGGILWHYIGRRRPE